MSKKGDTLMDDIFGNQAVKEEEIEEQETAKEEEEEEQEEEEEEQEDKTSGKEREEAEEEEESKLLAGKYKTVEELEKAYQEVQKWGTKSAQEVAALRRELEDLQRQVDPDITQRQQQQWQKQVQAAINAAVVDEDPGMLMALIGQVADQVAEQKLAQRYQDVAPIVQQRKFQREIDGFLAENPEAAEHMDDIAKLVQQDPEMVTKPGWLYRAYGKVLTQKFNAKAKSEKEAAAKTKAEKEAAAMPGAKSRQKQGKKDPEEELLDNIFITSESGGVFG